MSGPDIALDRVDGTTPQAAALLSALHGACFTAGWSATSFSSILAMPNTVALIARAGATPAGFLVCRSAADEGEIIVLGVAPEFRRWGIASRLLSDAVETLQDARSVHLEVADDNEPARAFYATHGFRETGRRKAYYDLGGGIRSDAIIMSLETVAKPG